jgi:hypothetical protein
LERLFRLFDLSEPRCDFSILNMDLLWCLCRSALDTVLYRRVQRFRRTRTGVTRWRGFSCFTTRLPAIVALYPIARLQKETSLSLGEFHGYRAFLVVIHHVIDPSAYERHVKRRTGAKGLD